jgi:hypothetical protein
VTPRVILFGQAPSRTAREPLDGRAGDRLASLAGLASREQLGQVFALGNLLPAWEGKEGKGDAFDLERARAFAEGWLEECGAEFDLVVMLGWNVARAFDVHPRVGYLRHFVMDVPAPDGFGMLPLEGVVFPHPSGVSHWWNDGDNVDRARAFLRVLAS